MFPIWEYFFFGELTLKTLSELSFMALWHHDSSQILLILGTISYLRMCYGGFNSPTFTRICKEWAIIIFRRVFKVVSKLCVVAWDVCVAVMYTVRVGSGRQSLLSCLARARSKTIFFVWFVIIIEFLKRLSNRDVVP